MNLILTLKPALIRKQIRFLRVRTFLDLKRINIALLNPKKKIGSILWIGNKHTRGTQQNVKNDEDLNYKNSTQPKRQKDTDLFDFDTQKGKPKDDKLDFDNFWETETPKIKQTFDDYFPESNENDDNDNEGEVGLISNLK